MRKWIIAGVILAGLCAVALIGFFNLNSLIQRNRDYLLARAERALNRKVSVGEINVTLLHGIGVRATDFSMSDDPRYSSGDFVRARELLVTLKFWPLLRKQFQIKRAVLHNPSIVLIRDANGQFNFSTIGQKEKEQKKQNDKGERQERTSQPSEPGWMIALVEISNGQIRYQDRRTGTDLEMRQVDLKLDDLDGTKPIAAQLGAALFAPKQNIHLNARIGPFAANMETTQVPLDGQLHIDTIDMGRLTSTAPAVKEFLPDDLQLSGVFNIPDLKFKGTLDAIGLNGTVEGDQGVVRYGKAFAKPAGTVLRIVADAQRSAANLVLRRMDVKIHSVEASVKGDVAFAGKPKINLAIDSKPASLEGWDRIVPALQKYQPAGTFETHATVSGSFGHGAKPDVRGALNLSHASVRPPDFPQPIKDLNAAITFNGQQASWKDSSFSLGSSRIRVSGEVESFSPVRLKYGLSTPEIRPADFQSVSEDRKNDVMRMVQSEGQLAMSDAGPRYSGTIVSGEGTLYKIPYKNFNTALSLANKVLTIKSLKADALSGTLQTQGEYASGDTQARFSLSSKVQGVDVKQLYATLSPNSDQDLRGRLHGEATISGRGKTWDEIKPTLTGQGNAQVTDGAILNFNVAENLLSSITGMPGMTKMINPQLRKKYPATFEAKDTEFKEMKSNFDIGGGRVNFKNLRIAAADYAVDGSGWADFDRKLDFKSSLLLSQPMSADIVQSTRELKYLLNGQSQVEIPFTVTGRLPKVRVRPDANYLARVAQRGLLGKGAEQLEQYLGNKEPKPSNDSAQNGEAKKRKKNSTEELIRKGLEGFFKRKD
ncbi:MAG TPA: AsmA family protein [Candidatus Binatia bacterium]|jgi:uncharacterized protein involved in outer membrane biogenesis